MYTRHMEFIIWLTSFKFFFQQYFGRFEFKFLINNNFFNHNNNKLSIFNNNNKNNSNNNKKNNNSTATKTKIHNRCAYLQTLLRKSLLSR